MRKFAKLFPNQILINGNDFRKFNNRRFWQPRRAIFRDIELILDVFYCARFDMRCDGNNNYVSIDAIKFCGRNDESGPLFYRGKIVKGNGTKMTSPLRKSEPIIDGVVGIVPKIKRFSCKLEKRQIRSRVFK